MCAGTFLWLDQASPEDFARFASLESGETVLRMMLHPMQICMVVMAELKGLSNYNRSRLSAAKVRISCIGAHPLGTRLSHSGQIPASFFFPTRIWRSLSTCRLHSYCITRARFKPRYRITRSPSVVVHPGSGVTPFPRLVKHESEWLGSRNQHMHAGTGIAL